MTAKPRRVAKNTEKGKGQSRKPPSASAISAREIALDLLDAVLGRRAPLDEAFHSHPALRDLELRDRAFALNLAATTLRRLGQIDGLIDHCLRKPLTAKAQSVRNLLRLGVCQLIFLETRPHAAVHATVAQALRGPHQRYSPLINAVLRRMTEEGRDLAAAQDATRVNTPDWLWQSWTAAYGLETCRRIAGAHLAEAPLDLTLKVSGKVAGADLADVRDASVLPTGTLRLIHHGAITNLPGFDAGAWWVQDAAAALPVKLLGNVAGQEVFDLCAAPGGKTAQLAAAGARVTAVDRAPQRLKQLEGNLTRLGLEAQTIASDAGAWRPSAPANAVILDAPCSATGTIRRHPDVPWLKTPADVAALAVVQARLLHAALDLVKPGGVLVYSVCSLQPEEGPDQVNAVLAQGGPFERVPVMPDEIGGLGELITGDGDLRTLPCHLAEWGGMDGFYAARLKRLPFGID
jgi:16S rRNA (cytosine967-C5)-methyltransferase